MYTSLIHHIRRYVSLTQEEEETLASVLRYQEVKNKAFVLQAGQVCNATYFIVQGCLRMYLNTDYGTEQIIQFGIQNWWMSDYTSFDQQKPSHHNIQAVENSAVVILEKQAQEELFVRIPQLERYFRIIYQRAYAATLTRIHYMLNLSGEERYHNFNNSFPEFVQRVPQYMLASYLGFTPEFLSKIRARKG